VVVLAAMVVVALVAGVVTAVVQSSHSSRRALAPIIPVAPSTTVPSGGGPAASTDPDQGVLPQLAVSQSDVGAGVTAGLINGGDQVTGAPTLDLCNGTFPSEQLRTARRQTAVADGTGTIAFSTEAVLYQSPNGTAQAFTELRRVAATCPPSFVPSPVGEPPAKTTFHARPDAAWAPTATVERLAYDFDTVDQQGNTQHEITVYLRRGRLLMGLYFSRPGTAQPAIGGQTTIPGIVTLFATRMASLPGSVVDRTYNPGTSA